MAFSYADTGEFITIKELKNLSTAIYDYCNYAQSNCTKISRSPGYIMNDISYRIQYPVTDPLMINAKENIITAAYINGLMNTKINYTFYEADTDTWDETSISYSCGPWIPTSVPRLVAGEKIGWVKDVSMTRPCMTLFYNYLSNLEQYFIGDYLGKHISDFL